MLQVHLPKPQSLSLGRLSSSVLAKFAKPASGPCGNSVGSWAQGDDLAGLGVRMAGQGHAAYVMSREEDSPSGSLGVLHSQVYGASPPKLKRRGIFTRSWGTLRREARGWLSVCVGSAVSSGARGLPNHEQNKNGIYVQRAATQTCTRSPRSWHHQTLLHRTGEEAKQATQL